MQHSAGTSTRATSRGSTSAAATRPSHSRQEPTRSARNATGERVASFGHRCRTACAAVDEEEMADLLQGLPGSARVEPPVHLMASVQGIDLDMFSIGRPVTTTKLKWHGRRIRGVRTLEQLLWLVQQEGSQYEGGSISQALCCLARMVTTHKQQLRRAGMWTEDRAHHVHLTFVLPCVRVLEDALLQAGMATTLDAQGACNSLWALSSLDCYDRRVFDCLCGHALRAQRQLNVADCAQLLVAFGKFGHYHPDLLKAIPQVMLSNMYDARPGEITQVLWGFAKLRIPGVPDPVFLEAATNAVSHGLLDYAPKELAIALWSLVHLQHHPGRRLLQRIERRMVRQLHSMWGSQEGPEAADLEDTAGHPSPPSTAPTSAAELSADDAGHHAGISGNASMGLAGEPFLLGPSSRHGGAALGGGAAAHPVLSHGGRQSAPPVHSVHGGVLLPVPPALSSAHSLASGSYDEGMDSGLHAAQAAQEQPWPMEQVWTPQDRVQTGISNSAPDFRSHMSQDPISDGTAPVSEGQQHRHGSSHSWNSQSGNGVAMPSDAAWDGDMLLNSGPNASHHQHQHHMLHPLADGQQQQHHHRHAQPPHAQPQHPPGLQGQQPPVQPVYDGWPAALSKSDHDLHQGGGAAAPGLANGLHAVHAPTRAVRSGLRGPPMQSPDSMRLQPQDISNVLWAFGKIRYKAAALLDELPLNLGQWLHTYSTEDLCSLLTGYTHARHYHQGVLNAVAPLLARRLSSLSVSELCIVLWSYGIFQHWPPTAPTFLQHVADALTQRLDKGRPQTWATLAKACANLRLKHTALVARICELAEAQLPEFSPEEMAALLYGLSHMAHEPSPAQRHTSAASSGRAGDVRSATGPVPASAPHPSSHSTARTAPPGHSSDQGPAALPSIGQLPACPSATSDGAVHGSTGPASHGPSLAAHGSALIPSMVPPVALSAPEMRVFHAVVQQCMALLAGSGAQPGRAERPGMRPTQRADMHYKVLNSVTFSCLRVGLTPWALIELAETRGLRPSTPQRALATRPRPTPLTTRPAPAHNTSKRERPALFPQPSSVEGSKLPGTHAGPVPALQAASPLQALAPVSVPASAEDSADGQHQDGWQAGSGSSSMVLGMPGLGPTQAAVAEQADLLPIHCDLAVAHGADVDDAASSSTSSGWLHPSGHDVSFGSSDSSSSSSSSSSHEERCGMPGEDSMADGSRADDGMLESGWGESGDSSHLEAWSGPQAARVTLPGQAVSGFTFAAEEGLSAAALLEEHDQHAGHAGHAGHGHAEGPEEPASKPSIDTELRLKPVRGRPRRSLPGSRLPLPAGHHAGSLPQ